MFVDWWMKRMERRQQLQILNMFLLFVGLSDSASTLTLARRIAETVQSTLVCTDTGSIVGNVNFFQNLSSRGGCIPTCGSGIAGYSVSQDKAAKKTYLHIASVDGSRDTGSWICRQGTDPGSAPLIISPPIPSYLQNTSVIDTPPIESLTTQQNATIFVPCASPSPRITWSYQKKNGPVTTLSIPSSTDPASCPAGQVETTSTFLPSSVQDTGIIVLSVTVEHDSFNPPTYTRTFSSGDIIIAVPVTNVSLANITFNNQEVGAAEGQSLTLTCVTSESYPAASVTWYKENTMITEGVTEGTMIISGVAMVTTSSLTLGSLSKSDLGHEVYCRATNQYTTSQVQSDSARLGVWYGPEQMDITVPDNTPAIENRDLTLTCTVTSYPAPTFTWDYTDGSSTGGSPGSVMSVSGSTSRWSQTLTFRPNKNKQTVRCMARNTRTSLTRSSTVTLNVKYPPTVSPRITQFKSTMFEGNTGEIITCSVSGGNPLAVITWTCPGTGSPSTSESGQTRTSKLTFTVTRGQNGQKCRCQGSWQYGGYSQSDVRTLSVSYPPSRPTLTVPSVVCEGRPVTSLNCSSSEQGNPPATYIWRMNTVPVSPGFSPVRSDDGATLRCSAGNIFSDRPGHVAPQSDSATLNVHYSPRVKVPTTKTYKEGDSLSVTCVSHSKPSTTDSDIRWMFGGVEVHQGPTLHKSDVNRRDHGVYQCTVTVNSQTCGTLQGTGNLSVVVNYAPNVTLDGAVITEGDSLTLACKAEGRPASYNFRSFTQFWGDTEIQTRVGVQAADYYTLRIDSASFMDSGVYECGVDNSVTDRNDHLLVQRKRVDVSVRGRPKFTSDSANRIGSEVGHSTTLYQTFYSAENCTYNWTFSGQRVGSLNTTSLYSAQVTLDIYGKTVQDTGWNVTLTVAEFDKNHQGLYTVTVCNSVGCNSSSVNLTAAGPPLVPLDFHVVNTTTSSILLQWKPNFPGGDFTQMFLLHYRKLGDSEWKTVEKEDTNNGYVSTELTGLEAGTMYEFRVRSVSNRDRDNMSPFTDIMTNKTGDRNVGTSSNSALAAGAGTASALLVIIIVVVIVVVVKRRRGKAERDGENRTQSTVKKERLGNGNELVMRENDLYATAKEAEDKSSSNKPVMKENDLYASSQGPNPADVYAQVKPKKKAEGDIYSQPVKNKGKGKEMVKEKGKENKKKDKKTRKDDKVPLQQKTRPKRGDVYENTVPGQFGDGTYANTAFVHDETETKQEAKSGKDDDGCTYVTVDFGSSSPGTVVHRDEEPTEYAGIAFGKVGPPLPPDEEVEQSK